MVSTDCRAVNVSANVLAVLLGTGIREHINSVQKGDNKPFFAKHILEQGHIYGTEKFVDM